MAPGVLHVDMDAFYAAVEVLDQPALRGRPVIVGGRPDSRGVVSAASYEARAFGVHSAMPLVRAARACPQGVFLPVRMERYREISERIFSVFHDYTPLVEGLSLDEAFLDVRESALRFGDGAAIGREIQRRIEAEIGLSCSVGVAPVKFVAKIASDLRKPHGLVIVEEEEVSRFLAPLAVERLWGVGEVTAARLRNLGITTIGEIRERGEEALASLFGEAGRHLHALACGIDPRGVEPDGGRKQVGHETTFAVDVGDREVLLAELMVLAEEVGRRARCDGRRGRTVTLKVRYAPFETHTARVSLSGATDATADIYAAARALFDRSVLVPPRRVRLLGVTLSGFADGPARQMDLFEEGARVRRRRVDAVVDRITERLGRDAIHRAGALPALRDSREGDEVADGDAEERHE